jgi:hypothetical protein
MTTTLANLTGDMPVRPPRDELEYQAGPPIGDATRHLCAAGYLDREFRSRAINELVVNSYRVPAPTPGTDHARVLHECLRARRLVVGTAMAMIVVGLLTLIVSPPAFALLAGVGVAAYLVRLLGHGGTTLVTRVLRANRWGDTIVRARRILDGAILAGSGAAIVAIALIGSLLGGSISFAATVLPVLAWIAVGAVFQYIRHVRLAALHRPHQGKLGTPSPRLKPVFERLEQRQAEAETVYGNHSPFVGCGAQQVPWTYGIEMVPSRKRHEEGLPPDPLDVPRLHATLMARLAALAAGDEYAGDLLHRLTVRDRVFRSGVRWDRPNAWLGGLSTAGPNGTLILDARWARRLDETSHERIRHYVEARAELWQDQVVVSVFVRVSVQGSQLYVEALPYVLPPIDRRYQAVDAVAPPDPFADGLAALGRAVINLPNAVADAFFEPYDLVRTWWATWTHHWRYRRVIKSNLAFDHAPSVSLRELAASLDYQQYFQYLDVERFLGSVHMRIMSTLLGVLDRAGYDIRKFEQIVNRIGVQNNNSTVNGSQTGFSQKPTPPDSQVDG